MQDNSPKKRLPRLERDDEITVHEDENSHLWAVSYSDFLMALLSFFILFFSMDTPARQTLILNLAGEFSNDGKGPGMGGKFEGQVHKSRIPATVLHSFKDLDVNVDKESLVINFPDNFFMPGRHIIQADHQQLISNFLTKLKPYENQVNIYFEGHTDDKPLHKYKNDIIVDNFVLSSLRASSALLVAKKLGFSESHLFIQAASSNLRNSRSLSIRIEPREEVL